MPKTTDDPVRVTHPSLAAALAAAQGEFPPIPKNKTAEIKGRGQQYSYKYADLADVIAAVQPALSKHGLAQTQDVRIEQTERGDYLICKTTLLHAGSDDRLESAGLPVRVNATPHDIGSAVSYMRRYSLCAVLGVSPDQDLDAKLAQEGSMNDTPPRQPRKPTTTPKQRPPAPTPLQIANAALRKLVGDDVNLADAVVQWATVGPDGEPEVLRVEDLENDPDACKAVVRNIDDARKQGGMSSKQIVEAAIARQEG